MNKLLQPRPRFPALAKHFLMLISSVLCGFGFMHWAQHSSSPALRWLHNGVKAPAPSTLGGNSATTAPLRSTYDFKLPITALHALREGDAAPMYEYVFNDNSIPCEHLSRFLAAVWRFAGPETTPRYLLKEEDQSGKHFVMGCTLCCLVSQELVRSKLLEGPGSILPNKAGLILLLQSECEPQWFQQNIGKLAPLYPEDYAVNQKLHKYPPTAESLQMIPALLATKAYQKDNDRVADTLMSALKGDETLLDENLASLVALVKKQSKMNGHSAGDSTVYHEAIEHARMMFDEVSVDAEGKMKISPLKLAAYLAARVTERYRDDGFLRDTLEFAQPSLATATAFLNESAKFKQTRDDYVKGNTTYDVTPLVQNPALTSYLARCLGDHADATTLNTSLEQMSTAMANSYIPESMRKGIQENIIASTRLSLSAEQVMTLPDAWQSAAASATLNTAAQQNVESLARTAQALNGHFSSMDLINASLRNQQNPFTTDASTLAPVLPPASLSANDLRNYVADGSASFALENPTLVKDGTLTPLFNAWAAKEPYDCSAYLNALPPSAARTEAIIGMIQSLKKYAPTAAEIWQQELQKGAAP
jgi:hypothetical protein